MRALLARSEFTAPHSHLLLSPMPINTKVTFLQQCLKKVTLRKDIYLITHRGNVPFDFHVAYSTCGISLFYLHVVTKYLFLCFIPGRSSSFSVYVILTTRTAGFAPAAWKLHETGCSTLFDFFYYYLCAKLEKTWLHSLEGQIVLWCTEPITSSPCCDTNSQVAGGGTVRVIPVHT